VAQFPWDPKPEPPPAPAPAPAPVAAPVHLPPTTQQQAAATSYTQSTLSPQSTIHPALAAQHANGNGNGMPTKADNESHIKQEPTMAGMSAPSMGYNNAGAARGGMAAQRAAQALENRYGQRAAASIDAIQSGQAQAQAQQQGQRPGQPQQPHQMQQMQQMQMNQQQMNQQQMNQQQMNQQQMNQQQMNQQHMNQQQMNQQHMMNQQQAAQHQLTQQQQQQQYRQGMAASMQQRMPQQPPSNLPKAQHDGAADGFEGVLLQHGPDGRPVEMGRVEIDKVIHAQMAARAREMEGGGLMVPLKEVKRRAGNASKKGTPGGPSQMDGPDDEDAKVELDEDAINSDLDDPDEPRDEDEDDDDSMGHMMLCMYDKVQRVKNKWYFQLFHFVY